MKDDDLDDSDAGEPQTMFLLPAEGGSYKRNPDGSLTRLEGPNPNTPTPAVEKE